MTSVNTPPAFRNYLHLCMIRRAGFHPKLNTDETKRSVTGEKMAASGSNIGINGKFIYRM
jgi:hypothetical protein